MSTLDLKSQLEHNTLAVNSLRDRIKTRREIIDFPHNTKTQCEAKFQELCQARDRVAVLESSYEHLKSLLNIDQQKRILQDLLEQHEALMLLRASIIVRLDDATVVEKQDKTLKPLLSKLDKAIEELKKLPQDELKEILAGLVKPHQRIKEISDASKEESTSATSGDSGSVSQSDASSSEVAG